MADFIAQDHVEDLDRSKVTGAVKLRLQRGRGIQPARLERAGHQCHAGHNVVGRALGHQPQAVVRVEVAIREAERGR